MKDNTVNIRLASDNYADHEKMYRNIFWCIALLLLGLMIVITPDFGSTGDELARRAYGKAVLHYYTGLTDHSADATGNHMQDYGGFFDGLSALFNVILKPHDEFLLRHYWNMLFGFAGLVFAGLIAQEITGKWRPAIITLLLLAATPRFFGDCFNNPKDIPFAASGLIVFYALIRWLKHLDHLQWKRTLFLAFALLLCLSIRFGGLLYFCYTMLFTCWMLIGKKSDAGYKKQVAIHLATAFLIGYLGCCLFWPHALHNPILHPFSSLKSQSKYTISLHTLFEGQLFVCKELPWYYGLKMLAITQPLVFFAGFISFLFLLFSKSGVPTKKWLRILFTAAVLPLLFMLVRKSVLYDGVRHLLFVISFLTICAGIGFDALFELVRHRLIVKYGVLIAGLFLLCLPLRFMIANHPNEYIYFNELTGGINGAFGNYETDYYMNSAKQAYDWLAKNEGKTIAQSKDSLKLATDCYGPVAFNYERSKPLKLIVFDEGFTMKETYDWDYGIFITRYLDKRALDNGYFPSSLAIHTIMADGVPICTVLKNDKERYGYKGWQARLDKNYPMALELTQKAIAQYPADVCLRTNLAWIFIDQKKYDEAGKAIEEAGKLSDLNENTIHLRQLLDRLKAEDQLQKPNK